MSKNREERRRYKRFDLPCPIDVCDGEGNVLTSTRAANVSDGGVFLPVPVQAAPPLGSKLQINFRVPRSTPNTYMLEEFSSSARVARHQPLVDNSAAGVALQFARPIRLQLEV